MSMANKVVTRRELLERWRDIEEEEEGNADDDDVDPSIHRRLHLHKEQWFADAYNFLICLPSENHIWCGMWEVMGPLLETFYNYYRDDREDSPLRRLWKRISDEMKHCLQCISQHHQAQDTYNMEYESSSIGPLLDILQKLDYERVTSHLSDINARITGQKYDSARDNAEVVIVLYEVLMFPILLDYQPLFTEFELFVEAIDNKHELALSGHQQFPGVYALLFCKRSVRSVGYRLAGSMGKVRRAADLEPLQPLLKKFIGCLEADALPLVMETSAPRTPVDRMSLWIGIKSLLGFLDPPAFEEGILENYPFFLDIVLNHISGDSLEFSHAVTCLRILFEMLGCKLWLSSTLSPSVMRNTLLGQCFHIRNEKIHKDIFGLFQPFLQSLEALHDGEHKKQRRHFLYFLLHQVPVSSNFSILTRKLACQIALLIVHRGYKMNPPCPPFECAHMWGPSLVSSLKDSSLHSSLRQPAFDLIQTIIVSDAAALIYSVLNCSTTRSIDSSMSCDILKLDDESDDIWLPSIPDGEEQDRRSSWSEFIMQSEIASQECREWMCIPMLWVDVLVDSSPSILPLSFSKAVFWARSRFPMVELESSAEMMLPVRSCPSSFAAEISSSFGWKVPTGSDDGGDGNKSKNSVEVLTMSFPLIRTFNRFTTHFLVQMRQGELRSQWIWEPVMSQSLILSLLDPNDDVRQFGKSMLEQVSETRGLSCGLKFLCSYRPSLVATILGLKHAMKLVQLDTVLLKFHTSHHFWFLLCKLLKDEGVLGPELPGRTHFDSRVPQFSSQGGFLMQPAFDSLPVDIDKHVINVELQIKEKFSCLLSEMAWPVFCRCLVKGKEFIDYNFCQMTCVRLLEILPILVDKLCLFGGKEHRNFTMLVKNKMGFEWIHNFMEWGKSSLKVVIVYWTRALSYLLNLFKGSCNKTSASTIMTIENLITSNSYALEELTEQVSRLSMSLSSEDSHDFQEGNVKLKSLVSKSLPFENNFLRSDIHSSSMEDKGLQILDFEVMTGKKDTETIVILSDDEVEPKVLSNSILSVSETGQNISDGNIMPHTAGNSLPASDRAIQNVSYMNTSKETEKTFQKQDTTDVFSLSSQKRVSGNLHNKLAVTPYIDSKGPESCKREVISKSKDRVNLIKSSVETVSTKNLNKTCSNIASKTSETVSSTGNKILSDFRDSEDDPLETALKSVGRTQLYVPKPTSILKRQVIQLKNTLDSRSTCLNKVVDPTRRFKAPSLDDWYKPILEIDYFAIVGLASARKDESRAVNKLKEVPVCFQSAEQYVEIFRPLVLEEFKAQLQNSFHEMSSWEEMFYGSLSVMSVERIDDFHIVRFVHDDGDSATCRSFSENDIVLLTKDPPQKSNHDVHMVGKVERREKDYKRSISIVFIRFYFQNGSSRLNQARRNLTERSKWHGCRIMSITPQIREFHALSSVKHIPLLSLILNPVKDSFCLDECKEPDLSKLCQSLQQTLRSSFNVTQLQAISVAMGRVKPKKTVELSLIQGPPGTGKTRTIVAIVSALLASPHKTNGLKNPLYETTSQNSSTYSRPKINQSAAIARAWQDAAMARQLNDDVQSSSKSSENCARQRILICAQSNAAVDELVSRISSHGLYGSNGKMYKPYLVRVGNAKTVHPNSLPFFIDTIVDQRVAEEVMHSKDGKNDLRVDSSAMLRSNLEKLADSIRFYETKRANLRDGDSDVKSGMGGKTEMSDAEIEMKLGKLNQQKRQIYKDLRNVQAQEKKANEETKTLRHKLRKSILMEAQIVVTTLSGCGGDLYGVCSERMLCSKFRGPSEHTLFDAVVIDEAAQALEPATLIPLQLLKSSGTQCIMVGDPKQLPATVLSTVASKFRYECSMFERLQRAGHPVIMLTEQYRMHPEICKFPSLHFYDNKLLNGSQMSSKSAPFHQTKGLGPYAFYDIIDGREAHGKNSGAMSLCNEHEADAAVEILRFFKKRYPAEFIGGRIGIITPYKCQLSLLRSRFLNAFGSSTIADMEFNTVDGFQGREVDILLLSTVRAAHSSSAVSEINSSSIGFVADIRRMNVALTRAKISLWILGNARTLQTNHNWAALVKDAKERNLIMTAKMPYHSMFKTAKSKCVIENSDNHARPLKHEKVKDSGHKVPKKLVNDNDTQVRKNKCVSDVKDMDMGSHDEKTISVLEKIALAKERDSKNKHICMKKDTPCVAGGREGKNKMKISLGKTPPNKGQSKFKNSSNGLNLPVEKTSGGHKASKPSESEKPAMYSRGDMSSSAEVSVSSTKESYKESDANNQGRASNQSMDAEISKRKQQREAVDAILNSCLISTKKDERSTKVSAKRSFSSSVANGSMKPPKKKRVRPDE
ncbi:P-loop containing nucleoside triphosphate hydrolase superfamily protein [Trifolium repens]|nr:P-loop containing nucleoside triphosphate hydrolase superfamily protein [Trifolium repens]